jgi:uncharacterized membrane protein YtjA (UPF0391 family)
MSECVVQLANPATHKHTSTGFTGIPAKTHSSPAARSSFTLLIIFLLVPLFCGSLSFALPGETHLPLAKKNQEKEKDVHVHVRKGKDGMEGKKIAHPSVIFMSDMMRSVKK